MKIEYIAKTENGERALRELEGASKKLVGKILRLGTRFTIVHNSPVTLHQKSKAIGGFKVRSPIGAQLKPSLITGAYEGLKKVCADEDDVEVRLVD